MRVLLWNCNNGLGKKEQIDQFRSFACDIAVVPELKESNIEAIKPDDSVWITNNFGIKKPKGLGVLAFNGWKLEELPRDEDMEIYIPLKLSKDELRAAISNVAGLSTIEGQGALVDYVLEAAGDADKDGKLTVEEINKL